MKDLRGSFNFQKVCVLEQFWEVALGMQFHAVHQQQLWPPEPDQRISYLQIHYLCRAWKEYISSLLFSLSTLPVSVFWTYVTSSATLMLHTGE